MKRNSSSLFILCLLSATMLSCSSSDKKMTDSQMDTTSITEIPTIEEAFTSPDLKWKDLIGNVAQCVTSRYEASLVDSNYTIKSAKPDLIDTLRFSNSGMITGIVMLMNADEEYYTIQNTTLNYDQNDQFTDGSDSFGDGIKLNINLTRDEDGFISKLYRCPKDSEVAAYGDEIVWKNGRIDEYTFLEYDMSSTWKRKYDQANRLIEEKSTYADIEEGGETIIRYEYIETDSIGNWTTRYITNEYIHIIYDVAKGSETRMKEPASYYIERREISYYPQ